MKPKPTILPGIAFLAAASLLDVKPSKAVLYIDFIPVSSNVTRVQASGSLNVALLPTGTGNRQPGGNATAPSGNDSARLVTGANDILRFTYTPTTTAIADNPGFRYRISGETNPFRGSNLNLPVASSPAPANNPFFIFRPTNGATGLGGQDFWLPNTYVSGAPISGFFNVNASLGQIGLFRAPGAVSANLIYTIGGEQIILREVVPGPVPLLGAAAAFGCSRRLRKRIKKARLSEAV